MIQPDEKTEKNTERLQCSIAYNSLCLPCDSVCWLFKTSSSLSCIKSLTDLSSRSECCPRNLLKSSKVLSSLKRNSSTKGGCFSTDCNSVVTLSSRRRDSPRIFTWEVMTRANQSKDKFAKRANENSEKTKVAGSSAGKCKWSSPYFFFLFRLSLLAGACREIAWVFYTNNKEYKNNTKEITLQWTIDWKVIKIHVLFKKLLIMHSQTQDNVVLSTELIIWKRFGKRLTLEMSSSETLYGGQFTLSTRFIPPPTHHHTFLINLSP